MKEKYKNWIHDVRGLKFRNLPKKLTIFFIAEIS
jgi:hypothetical protein